MWNFCRRVEQVADGDGFVTVWAGSAEADPAARTVAVTAPLLAVETGNEVAQLPMPRLVVSTIEVRS